MLAKTSMIACAVIGVTLLAGRAHAQLEPEPKPADPAAGEPAGLADGHAAGTERLTLPKGRLLLDAFLGINLSTDLVGKPISLSPDLWYGYDDQITVGLVHSAPALTGFLGETGTSLCLTGTDNGCSDLYPNFALEGRYQLAKRVLGFGVAAVGGLEVLHISDPFRLSLKAGAVGRWHEGPLAIEVQPSLLIALTSRTVTTTVAGVTIDRSDNRDILFLPVTGLYALTPVISLSAQLGLILPFEDAGDFYAVPLSIGGHYHVNESLGVTLAFSLPRLIGGGTTAGFDERSLTLGGTYAF